jgi:hypothetical protein
VDQATGTDYDWNVGSRRLNIPIDSKERVASTPGLKRVAKVWVPYLYMIASFERW